MIRTKLLIVALASALVAGTAAAQGGAPAGDATKGREKVQMCQGCHGIDGWRTAYPEVYHVPKIAGQAPNTPATGSHVEAVMNDPPNRLAAGNAPRVSSTSRAMSSAVW